MQRIRQAQHSERAEINSETVWEWTEVDKDVNVDALKLDLCDLKARGNLKI